jgi:hypothetical protein
MEDAGLNRKRLRIGDAPGVYYLSVIGSLILLGIHNLRQHKTKSHPIGG